jgi:hypothetical protein
VKPDMPGLEGSELDALYDRGARWLDGHAITTETSDAMDS